MSKAQIEKTLGEMDDLLIEAFNKQPLPGLAVGVVHQGKLVYNKAFGFADLETEKPVDMDTIFRIMSISKTFTSIGIMQLWEGEKFDLDDPVNPYLKSMKVQHKDPNAPQITFRHLMTHTSGVGETRGFMDFTRRVGGLGAKPDTRILSMPEYYNGHLTAEIYPGQKWAYANHAYAVLAQLIEDISGEPFAMYMRHNVFEPLGMMHSDYFMSERVHERLAQGYQFKKSSFKPVDYLRLNTPGCGGIFSCVNDMTKYVAALMNGGANEHGSVIKPETLKLMMTSQLDTDPRVFSMGLGFFLEHFGEHLVAEHSGGWPGFISSMRVIPEQNLAMLAFTNTSNGAPTRITKEILHRMLGLESPSEQKPDPKILVRPYDWSKFCGSYGPKPGLLTNARFIMQMAGEVEVYVQGGQLMVRGWVMPKKKGIPLHRADADDPLLYQLVIDDEVAPVLFHLDANNEVERVSVYSYDLYKRPVKQSLRFKAFTAIGGLVSFLLAILGLKMMRKKR